MTFSWHRKYSDQLWMNALSPIGRNGVLCQEFYDFLISYQYRKHFYIKLGEYPFLNKTPTENAFRSYSVPIPIPLPSHLKRTEKGYIHLFIAMQNKIIKFVLFIFVFFSFTFQPVYFGDWTRAPLRKIFLFLFLSSSWH